MQRSYELNNESRQAGWDLLDKLGQASAGVPLGADFERTKPRPEDTLRVTPTF